MSATTPNLGLTYPESSDHTRLWEHLQQLAEDVDGAVPLIQHGYTDINIVNKNQAGNIVTFPVAYASAPTVLSTSDDTYWNSQARNVTATQFNANVRYILNTAQTSTVRLYWVAFGTKA